jgi:hypothetical protein
MDLLLRMMRVRFGNPLVQNAFADGVGVILSDLAQHIKHFADTLAEFGSISRTRVNIPKTVGLPLWPEAEHEAGQVLGQLVPAWRDLPIRQAATYLGCLTGHRKEGQEWMRAQTRYEDMIRAWQWSALRLHFATMVYNVYARSVLALTAQVARLSEAIRAAEARGLRHAAPGPGTWATP